MTSTCANRRETQRTGTTFRHLSARATQAALATAFLCVTATAGDPVVSADDNMSPTLKHYYVGEALQQGRGRLAIDVVELATKFVFDEAPVDDAGMPAYGNPFITQGVIYPPGVVTVDADGNTNGVVITTDADGNTIAVPEFPELVLGLWICRGTVLADGGFNIETGPTVYTTQLFDFHEVVQGWGLLSVETSGLELIDIGKPIDRAVTGGTGPYSQASGTMQQTFIGLNASEGFSLRFEAAIQ